MTTLKQSTLAALEVFRELERHHLVGPFITLPAGLEASIREADDREAQYRETIQDLIDCLGLSQPIIPNTYDRKFMQGRIEAARRVLDNQPKESK